MLPSVELKGIREGILVTLGNGEWEDVKLALIQEIKKQPEFFSGAKLILDVDNQILGASALGKLRDLLSDHNVTLWAILTNSPKTEQNAQVLGMATKIHDSKIDDFGSFSDAPLADDEGIMVVKTLRSGNSIEYPGHITIIGDVNPGAEVIAGGNIVIWGKLRGLVHAGAEGNEAAIICALDLSPTQLRIADKIAIPPEKDEETKPEMAEIRGGQVVAEQWKI